MEIDFKKYIREKKGELDGGPGRKARYAHRADTKVTDFLSKSQHLRISLESLIRGYVNVEFGELMRHGVRVSPKQFPKLFDIISRCAHNLGIPIPRLFVRYRPVINAYTLGTNINSLVILASTLVDRFSDDELHFVIGHECGHIHNSHVTYGTLMRLILFGNLPIFLQVPLEPLKLALLSWCRKTEITADRAGLLCCQDLDVSVQALARLSLGSDRLEDEYDINVMLKQTEELRSSNIFAKLPEFWQTHPHIGRRIQALQLFAASETYYELSGLERPNNVALITSEELDRETSQIVKVW